MISQRLNRLFAPRQRVIYPLHMFVIILLMLLVTFQGGVIFAQSKTLTRVRLPEAVSIPGIESAETVTALISHYWPPLGGPNCSRFVGGQCVARMASGERWEDWIGRAAACPAEVPFWSHIILPGGEEFICLDRGGKIVTNPDGSIWIDLLVEEAPVPFGTAIEVRLIRP